MQRIFAFAVLWLAGLTASATHILGGYLQVRAVGTTGQQYEIAVILFMDDIHGLQAGTQQTTVTLCPGDGSPELQVSRVARRGLAPGLSVNEYRTLHTYSAPATRTISVSVVNRSDGSRNLPSSAVNTPYFLETTVDTRLANTTPGFAVPSNLFQAATGVPAVLNLKSTDAEGDSVVYSVARTRVGQCGRASSALAGYAFPNDVTRQGTFRIDPSLGILTWNAPTEQGRYVFVVRAEEYRNRQKISESFFDMTLLVSDRTGTTPLPIPPYEAATETSAGPGLITGLAEGLSDGTVSVRAYPVPVQNQLRVRVQAPRPVPARMQVLNGQGQLIREVDFQTPAAEHEITFDVSRWSPGAYLIRTFMMGNVYSNNVIKP